MLPPPMLLTDTITETSTRTTNTNLFRCILLICCSVTLGSVLRDRSLSPGRANLAFLAALVGSCGVGH